VLTPTLSRSESTGGHSVGCPTMSDDSNETLADDTSDVTDEAVAETTDETTGASTDETSGETADEKAARKAKADAAVAERQVVARRTVTSRRVTPKGGPAAAKKAGPAAPATTSKARDAKKTASVVTKAPAATPQQVYSKGPSPWWVPAIMFGLLIVGALIIMSNYMGVFGDASNIRLVIGLGFILGGIVTATQYR
jgi:hypothetical protein